MYVCIWIWQILPNSHYHMHHQRRSNNDDYNRPYCYSYPIFPSAAIAKYKHGDASSLLLQDTSPPSDHSDEMDPPSECEEAFETLTSAIGLPIDTHAIDDDHDDEKKDEKELPSSVPSTPTATMGSDPKENKLTSTNHDSSNSSSGQPSIMTGMHVDTLNSLASLTNNDGIESKLIKMISKSTLDDGDDTKRSDNIATGHEHDDTKLEQVEAVAVPPVVPQDPVNTNANNRLSNEEIKVCY
jgi:hypothetical protein